MKQGYRRGALLMSVVAGLLLPALPSQASDGPPAATSALPTGPASFIEAPASEPVAPPLAPGAPDAPGSVEPAGSARTSLRLTATYVVKATIAFSRGRITVHTAIHIRNTSGGPIGRLELNALPARIGNMDLQKVTVDGGAVHATIHRQTIRVPLGFTLPVGGETDVVVDYRAWFRAGLTGHLFLFSKANSILSAYRWIPWVSRDVAYEESWHGDPFVTPISPSVRVTFDSDVALDYATSGRLVAHSGRQRTYVAQKVRDFNFTAARNYHHLAGWSTDGQTRILIYTRNLNPHVILSWARRSIRAYEHKLGPYPYPTLSYGEASGGIGMESPGLIWLPHFFNASLLAFLVGHETAHQWFYAVVGNDQTTNPFADEAVAEFLDRWLFGAFRGSRCSRARLDLSMYAYPSSCYYEDIYIQGSMFLNNLRFDMGDSAFWSALRGYWQDEKWQLSSTKRLLEAFRAKAGNWVLKRYHARFPSLY